MTRAERTTHRRLLKLELLAKGITLRDKKDESEKIKELKRQILKIKSAKSITHNGGNI